MDPLFALILCFLAFSLGYLFGHKQHWFSDLLLALAWMFAGVLITLAFILVLFIIPNS